MKSEIETALHAHAEWRERFKDILNGRAPFELENISATDKCFFGNWLENEGHRMIPPEHYEEIKAVHQTFHHIAAEIIQKIKEKRYAEAHEDIALDGALNKTSIRLRELMYKLSFHEPSEEHLSSGQNSQIPDTRETVTATSSAKDDSIPPETSK